MRGYDAPAVVDVELVDGRKKRFLVRTSKMDLRASVHEWELQCF